MIKYQISRTKLYAELKKRGVKPAEASKEMGYSDTYLSHISGLGEISERGALYLDRLYKISPEDYAPDLLDALDRQTKETPEKRVGAVPDDVYKAMAQAFAEAFREPIKKAVLEAIKEAGL